MHEGETSTCFSCFFRMANHGRTIILSIHQPRYSIYRLFDSLTLLVNGKQVPETQCFIFSSFFVALLSVSSDFICFLLFFVQIFFCHFFVAFFPYWGVFLLFLMLIFLIRCSFVPSVVVLSSTFCFVFVSLFWLFWEIFCCPFSSLFLLSVFFVQSGFLTSFSRL